MYLSSFLYVLAQQIIHKMFYMSVTNFSTLPVTYAHMRIADVDHPMLAIDKVLIFLKISNGMKI